MIDVITKKDFKDTDITTACMCVCVCCIICRQQRLLPNLRQTSFTFCLCLAPLVTQSAKVCSTKDCD